MLPKRLLYLLIFSLLACSKEVPIVEIPESDDCFITVDAKACINALVNRHAIEFSSADPNVCESQLDSLVNYFKGADIVGLGEATHGSSEFFKFKDKLFRCLVDQLDFKSIIFEIPWGNCVVIDDYVTNGIGTVDSAFDQSWYWVYDTQETRDLAIWMNQYNLSQVDAEKIHLVGCDPQGPNFELEKKIIFDYVAPLNPILLDSLLFWYSGLPNDDLKEYHLLSNDMKQINKHNVQRAYDEIEASRESFVSLTSSFEYERILMASHVIQHRELMYRIQSFGQTRDSLMAVYSLWWQRIIPGKKPAAVWAHNLHVMDNSNPGTKWMGTFLRDSLNQNYKNLGFSFGKGGLNAFLANGSGDFQSSVREQTVTDYQCGTLNATLSELEADQYYLIFDQIQWPDSSHLYLNEPRSFFQMGAGFNPQHLHNYTSKWIVPDMWDVLVHFDEVVASELK